MTFLARYLVQLFPGTDHPGADVRDPILVAGLYRRVERIALLLELHAEEFRNEPGKTLDPPSRLHQFCDAINVWNIHHQDTPDTVPDRRTDI
uniref:Uncharacterized protein n=1 Tax=uncultured marine virus TaxID=186617 RepID=A0A0F7L6V0_9VIRU|nr:hypothetical protein [uncultured marine virus]